MVMNIHIQDLEMRVWFAVVDELAVNILVEASFIKFFL